MLKSIILFGLLSVVMVASSAQPVPPPGPCCPKATNFAPAAEFSALEENQDPNDKTNSDETEDNRSSVNIENPETGAPCCPDN